MIASWLQPVSATARAELLVDKITAGSDWKLAGNCAGLSPTTVDKLFFPEHDTAGPYGSYARARQVCEGCPIKGQCLDFADEQDEQYGMWGGLTPAERASRTAVSA